MHFHDKLWPHSAAWSREVHDGEFEHFTPLHLPTGDKFQNRARTLEQNYWHLQNCSRGEAVIPHCWKTFKKCPPVAAPFFFLPWVRIHKRFQHSVPLKGQLLVVGGTHFCFLWLCATRPVAALVATQGCRVSVRCHFFLKTSWKWNKTTQGSQG